jgi:hypothetical protein
MIVTVLFTMLATIRTTVLVTGIFNLQWQDEFEDAKGGGRGNQNPYIEDCYYYVDCGIRWTVKVKLLLD